jgi:hypothetical protein
MCKYDVDLIQLKNYYYWFKALPTEISTRWNLDWSLVNSENGSYIQFKDVIPNTFPALNIFLYPDAKPSMWRSVCKSCDLSPCPMSYVFQPETLSTLSFQSIRPIFPNGCGTPCLVKPNFCTENTTHGCLTDCNIPANSIFSGYSSTTSLKNCLWKCKFGFFLSDDNQECIPCSSAICSSLEFYRENQYCQPTSKKRNLCMPCTSNITGAILNIEKSIESNQCQYDCYKEGELFYKNPDPYNRKITPCIKCSMGHRCPPGYKIVCAPNPCEKCPPLDFVLEETATYVMTNSTCKAVCNQFYLTTKDFFSVNRKIVPDALDVGYNPEDIYCISCETNSKLCTSSVSCTEGQAIDVLGKSCLQCKSSIQMGCSPGSYAYPCYGGRIPQIACVSCQTLNILFYPQDKTFDYWPSRFLFPILRMHF